MSGERTKLVELVTHWLEMPEPAEPVIKKAYNARKPLPRSYSIKNADAWCACMVSEALSEIFPGNPYREVSADKLYQLMAKDWGTCYDFSYAIPGDAVFYDWNNNGSIDHTGFIVDIKELNGKKYVTTIEGNVNDRMYKRVFVAGEAVNGCKMPRFIALSYPDMAEEHAPHWYDDVMKWATDNGYITEQRPNDPITRAELLTILKRVLDK